MGNWLRDSAQRPQHLGNRLYPPEERPVYLGDWVCDYVDRRACSQLFGRDGEGWRVETIIGVEGGKSCSSPGAQGVEG